MPTVNPVSLEEGKSEAFYSGAMTRIRRTMPVLGLVFAIAVLLQFGWQAAMGFVVGCAIGYVNFVWLERVVAALADRVTSTGKPQSNKGIVARFLFRYALIALGCYAIFRISRPSLFGLLAGLFLPVAAIVCEAFYEVYAALRRGI